MNSDPGVQELVASSLRQGPPGEALEHLLNKTRVLSGITEVTEEGGSFKRKSSSPDSIDKNMYLDSMHAAKALAGLHVG